MLREESKGRKKGREAEGNKQGRKILRGNQRRTSVPMEQNMAEILSHICDISRKAVNGLLTSIACCGLMEEVKILVK